MLNAETYSTLTPSLTLLSLTRTFSPCTEVVRHVDYNPSDRLTTFMYIGPDDIEETVTYYWTGKRRLPLYAYVQIGTPEELVEELVEKMYQHKKQVNDRTTSSIHRAIEIRAAAKAARVRNLMDFDAIPIGQDITAREALFFIPARQIGETIDFSEYLGEPGMFIFHGSLRLIEEFDKSISNGRLMLCSSNMLSEESRDTLFHEGHSSKFNYGSGNPASLGPFLQRHWPNQVRSVMQDDGSITLDLFAFFPIHPDYHTFAQVKLRNGNVSPRQANMVRSSIQQLTASMVIRVECYGGNINLQDPNTKFTVLYADGNMDKRLDLPLDHESFVTTKQGIFTRGYYEEMAKQGKVDHVDLLPDADASQSYDVADEVDTTSDDEESHLTQRAAVLSSMVQNGSSDPALISILQETACDIADTTPSGAKILLSDSSSLLHSTVAGLTLHKSPAVREQANELLEATITLASTNLSHRDGSCVRRMVEGEIHSAKRKMESAKRLANMEVELAQQQKVQNDIKRRRQDKELEIRLSNQKSAEALAHVTPRPPRFNPKRQKTSAAAPDCDCEFTFFDEGDDHKFKARLCPSSNPDLFRRFISNAVFDCRGRKKASVDTFTKVISSQRYEVIRAKLYPNKRDKKDYNRFIEKYSEEILFWKVAEKAWVYAIPPFILSQLDIADNTRMRIVLVKQG